MAFSTMTNGYVTYHLPNNKTSDIKLVTFKGIKASNGYQLDRNRYVAAAFNFIIGRFMYFREKYGQCEDSETIIMTNHDLAKNIGCNEDHAQILMNQITDLFGLETYRESHRAGARRVKLNRQIIEYLKVFSEEDYTNYLKEFNLNDSKNLYALRQIFKHRIFTVRDKNLNKEEQSKKEEFLDRQRTYLHKVATSNVSINGRIKLIAQYQDKISPMEQKQFDRIKEERKTGKLKHYFYTLLVRIDNHVRAIKKAIENQLKRNDNEETTATTDRNKTKGEQETTRQVSAIHKKEPEQENIIDGKAHEVDQNKEISVDYDENRTPTLNKVVTLISLWNYVSDQSMPEVKRITERKVNSISKLISKYGYTEVLFAIRNTVKLYYDPKRAYKMTIERLSNENTFEYVLSRKDAHPSVSHDTINKGYSGMIKLSTLEDQCPSFKTVKQANTWFTENVLR